MYTCSHRFYSIYIHIIIHIYIWITTANNIDITPFVINFCQQCFQTSKMDPMLSSCGGICMWGTCPPAGMTRKWRRSSVTLGRSLLQCCWPLVHWDTLEQGTIKGTKSWGRQWNIKGTIWTRAENHGPRPIDPRYWEMGKTWFATHFVGETMYFL